MGTPKTCFATPKNQRLDAAGSRPQRKPERAFAERVASCGLAGESHFAGIGHEEADRVAIGYRSIVVEFGYSDTDCSDPTFSYDRNSLTVSAMRTY